MASSDVSLDSSSDSEAADVEEYELEVEDSPNLSDKDSEQDEGEEAYANEPLADEKWLARYEEEKKMEKELEQKLQKRLSGTEEVPEW